MIYYRQTWPNGTITPKLHILEDHVIPFLQKWPTGLGIYSEQGGEGIHPEFNALKSIFCRMPSATSRVKSMMKEHFIRVHPRSLQMRPKVQSKKRKETEE